MHLFGFLQPRITMHRTTNIKNKKKTQHELLNSAKPTAAWRGVSTVQHRDMFKFLHLYNPQTGTVLSQSTLVQAVHFLTYFCEVLEKECREVYYVFPQFLERLQGKCLETCPNLHLLHPIQASMHYYTYNFVLYNLDLLTKVISKENGRRFHFTGGSHIGRTWDHG